MYIYVHSRQESWSCFCCRLCVLFCFFLTLSFGPIVVQVRPARLAGRSRGIFVHMFVVDRGGLGSLLQKGRATV